MAITFGDEPNRGLTRIVQFGDIAFDTLSVPGEPLASQEHGGDSASGSSTVITSYPFQTVYRTSLGDLHVVGDESRALNAQLAQIPAESCNRLVFTQADVLECVLDAASRRCWFVDHQELRLDCIEQSEWVAAASDGRGRWMAIDSDGALHLFQSTSEFRAATGNTGEVEAARENARFVAFRWTREGEAIEDQGAKLPAFNKVCAGNAHFVLLSAAKEAPVWMYGDSRFGAIPLHPFPNTDIVGKLPQTQEYVPPTDVPFLMPVPHFFPSEGFPCGIKDISAGSRHTLVLTCERNMYGWGWNEEASLLPFATPDEGDTCLPAWEENIIPTPTLISLDSDVTITKIVASNERSFAVTTCGHLLVSGSNHNNTLGLPANLEPLQRKPRLERAFSVIKRQYECANGFQVHPTLDKVVHVHASSMSTVVTLEA